MLDFFTAMHKYSRGFTLVELLIVMAVVGILAVMAVPRFAELIDKSKEGATKGHLGNIRSAVQVYYGQNDGFYPVDNLASIVPDYLVSVPVAKTPRCARDSNAIHTGDSSTSVDGSGGWAYNNSRTDADWGRVAINCLGTDLSQHLWTEY
ncbi:MAG: prepilin-type N-terminal cleavage/methylation domain-containing protein [Elusimicrobia bacterium]|nr:prepilin-type N-terminal cleavage/methylation domain-containing protein [Elusimicrobiota bacterium]